jgi:hypothetical protein
LVALSTWPLCVLRHGYTTPSSVTARHHRHLSLYKFAFSLDDHVKLTNLLLDVFFIDGLDYTYQERIAVVLRR